MALPRMGTPVLSISIDAPATMLTAPSSRRLTQGYAGPVVEARDDHEAERLAFMLPLDDAASHDIKAEGDFGNQDGVSAAGDARSEGDPAGVAAHDFENHDPVVGLGGSVEPVQGLGGHTDGGVKAEGLVGGAQVVVDRLGHADGGQAQFEEGLGDRHGAVAANEDEALNAKFLQVLDDIGAQVTPFVVEGVILVGRAQNGAAPGQNPRNGGGVQNLVPLLNQASKTVHEPDDFDATLIRLFHNGAHNRIQTRSIASGGKYPNSTQANPSAHVQENFGKENFVW